MKEDKTYYAFKEFIATYPDYCRRCKGTGWQCTDNWCEYCIGNNRCPMCGEILTCPHDVVIITCECGYNSETANMVMNK